MRLSVSGRVVVVLPLLIADDLKTANQIVTYLIANFAELFAFYDAPRSNDAERDTKAGHASLDEQFNASLQRYVK